MNYRNLNLSEPLPKMFDSNESFQSLNLGAVTSSFFLTVDLILLVPMCYLYYLLILMIRREEKKKCHVLLKNLLMCYATIIPTAFLIGGIYIDIILIYTYPPFEVLGDWFCVAFQLIGYFFAMYAGGFSLFTAISKFWFLVCSKKARNFGEDRAKTIIFDTRFSVGTLITTFKLDSQNDSLKSFLTQHFYKLTG